MAAVQGGYDRGSNGDTRLQPDFPSLAISMGQRGGQAGLLFAFQLKPLVTGRRRPALVRKTECSRQGGRPSCLPQTSGADTAPGGRGARDIWTLGGTSRPAGETVKEPRTGPKQETTDSKSREGGEMPPAEVGGDRPLGIRLRMEGRGTGQSSASRLERGQARSGPSSQRHRGATESPRQRYLRAVWTPAPDLSPGLPRMPWSRNYRRRTGAHAPVARLRPHRTSPRPSLVLAC